MNTKELQEEIANDMKRWQKVEEESVASAGQIMAKTDNSIVKLVMEVIQRDSQMHHRLQGLIVESLERKAFSLTPEELGGIRGMIERHIQLEERMIECTEEALSKVKGKTLVLQEYLLNYLLVDERKHRSMLDSLEKVKKGIIYP